MEMHLKTARILTDLLENKFKIGGIRFGLDPVISIIPGFGDFITAVASFYLVWIGVKMRIPQTKTIEMLGNIALDFFIGLLPVVGDMTDFVFKSNSRNMRILEEYAGQIVEGQIVD